MHEQDIKETAILLRDEIAKAQKLTNNVDIHEVFLSAETIVSCLSYLISPIADMEQRYRKLAIPSEEESNAAAEARAKASDEYKEWRKYERLYSLGEEQIKVLKAFSKNVNLEFKRT